MTNPTRLPNGITNVGVNKTFSQMKMLDPAVYTLYHEDFCQHSDIVLASPTSHTVTKIGTGTLAYTNVSGAGGGWLLLTNSSASGDGLNIQHKSESFCYVATKTFAIKSKFQVDDATNSQFFVGAAITDTTALDATTRIGFEKASASTTVNCVSVTGGTTNILGSVTAANATDLILGVHYDPDKGELVLISNGNVVARSTTLSGLSTTVAMTPTINIKNGTAAARSLTMDYLTVAFER